MTERLLSLPVGGVGGLQWRGEPKRLETEASTRPQLNSLNLSSPFDLNFPLPGEKGPACLVKVGCSAEMLGLGRGKPVLLASGCCKKPRQAEWLSATEMSPSQLPHQKSDWSQWGEGRRLRSCAALWTRRACGHFLI